MAYDKVKIEILDSKTWYDKIASIYHKFHSKLDSRDRFLWQRYLPRNLSWKKVIDLWAWDCRLYKFFKNAQVEYTACDISENMLKRCPNRVEKIICDLNLKNWGLSQQYDIALVFFVLLHIVDLENFFENLYSILNPWWRAIVLHHIERRSFVYKIDWKEFKIQSFAHNIKDIEKIAQQSWFEVYIDKIDTGSWVIVLDKS